MTAGLTPAQSKALAFIERHITANGVSPSFDEIAEGLGLASKSGVHRLVVGLEERGRIRRMPDRARSIEIVERVDTRVEPSRKYRFHLQRILDAISCSGFIGKDDPIVTEARAAMGEGRS